MKSISDMIYSNLALNMPWQWIKIWYLHQNKCRPTYKLSTTNYQQQTSNKTLTKQNKYKQNPQFWQSVTKLTISEKTWTFKQHESNALNNSCYGPFNVDHGTRLK